MKNIFVLTGAGISAESGVPVFRGPDGLWHGRRVEEVATHEALRANPWGVNAFFNELRAFIQPIQPNPAHLALAKLERTFPDKFLLVTQNVDPLHERAGTKNLIPMHGELLRVACDLCGKNFPFRGEVTQETTCACCGEVGGIRPDIVLFGEIPKQMDEIVDALEACNLFLCIGTSGNVYPAAGFVDIARRAGAHCVEFNLSPTEISYSFDEHIFGPAGETVPAYVADFIGKMKLTPCPIV